MARAKTQQARIPTQDSIQRYTIKVMRELGTHKKQYNRIIGIYAGLVHQYLIMLEMFETGGYQFEVETGQGGMKKAPIVATLENLRKDILAYSDRLCLNPKAFEAITVEKPTESRLDKILSAIDTT